MSALLSVSALVEDLPQIAELDCNPIIVTPDGAAIVDVRIRVVDPHQWKRQFSKRTEESAGAPESGGRTNG